MDKQAISSVNRHSLLGVNCNATTIPELLQLFRHAIETNQTNVIVGNHNVHSIYLFQREPGMRRFYDLNAITYIDSMPLIFLGKLLGLPLQRKHRTAFLDWHKEFLLVAEAANWRIFYLGGREQSLKKASRLLSDRYPKLSIRFHHGFFSKQHLPTLYKEIQEYRPNILLVGMGMPLQENWIVDSYEHVHANVILNGGAMMEYIVGEQTITPRWLGQLGLEWLFRFATQPRRLAHRYLIEPFCLLEPLARDLMTRWNGAAKRPLVYDADLKYSDQISHPAPQPFIPANGQPEGVSPGFDAGSQPINPLGRATGA